MRIIIICAIAGILGVPAFGQGIDPLIGTWKMNVEKSTLIGRPLPQSEILHWTGEGQTFVDTITGVDAEGHPIQQMNVHIYDGIPHLTVGNPNYDASTYTRTGNTINVIRLKNGKPVGFGLAVIDPGKTYTFTIAGIANNQPYYGIVVYDRQ